MHQGWQPVWVALNPHTAKHFGRRCASAAVPGVAAGVGCAEPTYMDAYCKEVDTGCNMRGAA